MKLHLPISLYRYLLGFVAVLPLISHTVSAVEELPYVHYTNENVSDATGLKANINGSTTTSYGSYRCAFILNAPEGSTDNTVYLVDDSTKDKNYQMQNGWVFFTSDASAPVNLDISGVTQGVVWTSTAAVRGFDVFGVNDFTLSGNTNSTQASGTSSTTLPVSNTYYGALTVRSKQSAISISNNTGNVTLKDNVVSKFNVANRHVRGAAIGILGKACTLNIDNNQAVTISGNKATGAYKPEGYEYTGTTTGYHAEGGAVYLYQDCTFSLSNNAGLVTLEGNEATHRHGYAHGGAVAMNSNADLNIAGNTAGVLIHSNKAESQRAVANTTNQAAGGFVYGAGGTAALNITGNSGAAFYEGKHGAVIIADNAAITAGCGAQGGAASVVVSNINGNRGDVLVLDNYVSSAMAKASSSTLVSIASAGGAFYVGHSDKTLASALQISGNENVTISGNHADAAEGYAMGGAIYAALAGGVVDISGNTGKVEISGNYAKSGQATAVGGAVYALGGIRIEGNDDVLLRGNYEQSGDTFRLRSLYYSTAYGSKENTSVSSGFEGGSQFRLMAAEGKKIEIHDSVYSGRSGTGVQVVFNGSYTAADGTEVKGDGTILFTGANTVADLKAAKLNAGIAEERITISDEEINNSRTSEFKTNIQLLGGRLVIADQAQIKGVGLTVENGAAVELRNGILNHAGSTLSFSSGTALELAGINTVAGNVEMDANSYLNVVFDQTIRRDAAMTLTGTLAMAEGAVVQLSGFDGYKGSFKLFDLQDTQATWTGVTFVNEAGGALDSSLLVWEGNVLYYKNSAADLVWNSGVSDGKWNNTSQNWAQNDTQTGISHQENVYFGSNSGENIELEGALQVTNMTVQEGGSYVYTENESAASSLSVLETLKVEAGASVDVQLSNGVEVNATLESAGDFKASKITGFGHVLVTGGSLELADKTDALDVEGDVTITNTELRGTWAATDLSVGGSTVAAGADITLGDATITSPVTTKASGTLALQGKLNVQSGGLVLAGGHLKMGTSLEDTQTGVIVVQDDSKLTLKEGAEVSRGNIAGLSSDNVLTVEGKGKLNLGASADTTGYLLSQDNWSGTVKLENVPEKDAENQTIDLRLTQLGGANSSIELENCAGHTGAKDGTITADLVLTKSFDGTNEQAAFQITDGYSEKNADYVMNTIKGKVSGAGKMVFAKDLGDGNHTGFKFEGDVSDWNGTFEMASGNTFNLVFGEDANQIAIDIKKTGGNSLNLKLQSGKDMSLSGNITTDSIEISNTRKVEFSGNVDTDSLKVSSAAELVFGGESSSSTISSLTSKDDIQLTKNGSGTLQISGGASAISSLEVNGGILEMAGYVDSSKSINSNITVNSGAELRFSDTVADILNYSATGKSITVNGGTVDFGATRQTMGTWGVVLSNGALLSGSGNSQYGAFDFNESNTILVTAGTNEISAVTRIRDKMTLGYDVAAAATLNVTGKVFAEGSDTANIIKSGAGTLVLQSAENKYKGTTTIEAGKIVLDLTNGGNYTLQNKVDGAGVLEVAEGTTLVNDSNIISVELDLNGGNATLKGDKQNIQGDITVRKGATLSFDTASVSDTLQYSGEHKLTVHDGGTVDFRTTRQTMGGWTIDLYGGTLKGDGQTYDADNTPHSGAIDYHTATAQVNAFEGDSTITATTRLRGESTDKGQRLGRGDITYYVAGQASLDVSGLVHTDGLHEGGISKTGKGTLHLNNSDNDLDKILVLGGIANIHGNAEYSLDTLQVEAESTAGFYTGETGSVSVKSTVTVSSLAQFGTGATLNGSMTLATGATVDMGGKVKLDGMLTLQARLTLDGAVLAAVQGLDVGESYTLFTGVNGLNVQSLQQTVTLYNMRSLAAQTNDALSYRALMDGEQAAAADYFSNLAGDRNLVLSYNSAEGTVSITHAQAVPEPTAATLSLLALAGLCARRRRK